MAVRNGHQARGSEDGSFANSVGTTPRRLCWASRSAC